jgi:hypothetical protein
MGCSLTGSKKIRKQACFSKFYVIRGFILAALLIKFQNWREQSWTKKVIII